jgi:hypothetical protein
VSIRHPVVEGPQASGDREPQENGKKPEIIEAHRLAEHLHRPREGPLGCELAQHVHVEGAHGGDEIQGQGTHQGDDRPHQCVEHQLHRCVFLAGGAPDGDQEVFGEDGDLIEEEQEHQIAGHEDPRDAAGQKQHKGEELVGTIFDVPGDQHAGEEDQGGEQHQRQADAIRPHVVMNPQLRQPGDPLHELIAASRAVVSNERPQGQQQREARDCGCEDPRRLLLMARDEQQDERPHQGREDDD